MPHITPVELGLAVLAVCIVFGPKSMPSFKGSGNKNMVDLSGLAPSQPAAARAPSPLSTSVAPPAQRQFAMQPQVAAAAPAAPQQQYAMQPPQPQFAELPPEFAQPPQNVAARQPHPGSQEPQYEIVGTTQPLKLPEEF